MLWLMYMTRDAKTGSVIGQGLTQESSHKGMGIKNDHQEIKVIYVGHAK